MIYKKLDLFNGFEICYTLCMSRKKRKKLKLSNLKPTKLEAFILIAFFILGIFSWKFLGYFNQPKQYKSPSTITVTNSPAYKPDTQQAKNDKIYKLVLYNPDRKTTKTLSEFLMKGNNYFGYVNPVRKGDTIYLADANTITKYSLPNKQSQIIYTNPYNDRVIQSLSLDDTGYLYVGLSPKDYYAKNSTFSLDIVDLASGKTSRTLSSLPHVTYGGISYLFKAGDYDIIASFGGDGCGGYGEISKFIAMKKEQIAKTGVGCLEEPRYIGTLPSKNQILLANVLPGSWNPSAPQESVKYDVLYGQNALTGEKEPLYDLKKIPELSAIILNEEKNTVLLATPKNLSLFDLEKKIITKTIEFKSEFNGAWTLKNNELIDTFYYPDSMSISLIDVQTGNVKQQMSFPTKNDSYNLLGKWNNEYLFFFTND